MDHKELYIFGESSSESVGAPFERIPKLTGITNELKLAQRLRNYSMSSMINSIEINKDFEVWFNNYSFAWVPKFAKPMIKQWVKAAYFAGRGEVK